MPRPNATIAQVAPGVSVVTTGPTARWRRIVQGLLVPIVLLVAWETYARTIASTSDTWAPFTKSMAYLWETALDGSLWSATGFTLGTAFLGLALGGGLGVLLGVVIGLSRLAERAAFLSVEVFRPIPSVALIPIAMLSFGFGVRMELSIVAFACFWPLLILTQAAVKQVEPRLLEVAHALGFTPRERVMKFVLPAIVPRFIVALRLGVAIALVVAVTVEVAANPHGLGYGLIFAQQSLRPEWMLGWLVWLGVVGYAVNELFVRLDRAIARRMGVTPA